MILLLEPQSIGATRRKQVGREHGDRCGALAWSEPKERDDVNVVRWPPIELLDILQETAIQPLESLDESNSLERSSIPQESLEDCLSF